jgi:hypothetical protein
MPTILHGQSAPKGMRSARAKLTQLFIHCFIHSLKFFGII